MARIRTIKPDFWTDESLTECSLSARLLFIGMWNFSDDNGNIQRSAKQLKMKIFPADAIDCEPLVQELLTHGLLMEYSVSGEKFLNIKGFLKHQLINRPSKSNVPTPQFSEDSVSTHGVFTDGREGKGREYIEPTVLVNAEPLTLPDPVDDVAVKRVLQADRLPCPLVALAKLWNDTVISLPAVKPAAEWHVSRRTAMQTRWRERWVLKKYANEAEGLAYWQSLFAAVEASDFLSGRGDSGWSNCSFDWVLQPKNFAKLSEGNYVNVVGKFKGNR
jgi:hypothetical protein